MKIFTNKNNGFNFLGATLVVAFVFIALFGLNLSMTTNAQGEMVGCPFMQNEMSLCPMSATQHIAEWRQAFAANPQNQIMAMLIALLGLTFVFLILENFFDVSSKIFIHRYKRYRQEHPNIKLFNYLQVAFSQGLLQPKLYA